jgi:hypothetical protein
VVPSIALTSMAISEGQFLVGFVCGVFFLCLVLLTFQYVIYPYMTRSRRRVQGDTAAKVAEQELASVMAAFAQLPRREVEKHDEVEDCPICMTGYTENRVVVLMPCTHAVHFSCMEAVRFAPAARAND